MISKEDVKRVAKLARIGITKKEEEKFAKDLSSILDYIEKLKEVDVSKVKPTAHSIEMENVMRSDPPPLFRRKYIPKRPLTESGGGLLDLAPETKDGYLKTKAIL